MVDPRVILEFLRRVEWLPDLDGPVSLSFLAAGEYNENWLVETPSGRKVFRVNHGSQLGLACQIEYEYAVLEALAGSGVTPRPLAVDSEALGLGALLMEWLPGGPLDYVRDRDAAARLFAKVHAQAPDKRLLVQANPIQDIADESWALLRRYPDHPRQRELDRLLKLHADIEILARAHQNSFADDPLVIANTEVNSGNFLVSEAGVYLVDWEKAVLTSRYQDLGHFLTPTTTLWKSEHIYDETDKWAFVAAYLQAAKLNTPLDEARELTRLLERTILLRGLSWCFMAWYEYTSRERTIRNQDTFKKMSFYLDEMAWLFGLMG